MDGQMNRQNKTNMAALLSPAHQCTEEAMMYSMILVEHSAENIDTHKMTRGQHHTVSFGAFIFNFGLLELVLEMHF